MKKLFGFIAALIGAALLGILWHKHASDPAAPSLGEFVDELPMADIKILRPWTWCVGLSTAYRAARLVNTRHQHKA